MTHSAAVLDPSASACRQRLANWTHTWKMNMLRFLICLPAVIFGWSLAQAQLIIANPSVKVSDVSKGDIKDAFTGDSSTIDGSCVTPILLKSGPTQDRFLRVYIGRSEAAFMTSWRTLVFSGQATMPRSVDSEAAAVAFVAKTPGAIGYIDKNTPHEGVKVLADK